MKRPILSLSIFSSFLLAGTAYATIDCAVLPTCDSLRYSDDVSTCPNDYLVCPFDSTKGKCLHDAKPGSVQYFTKAPGKGWLQCNGYFYHKDAYPDLYAAIGTTIGGSGSVFQVPDYAGDFLRVYGGNSGSINKRQQEGLPNIYGYFGPTDDGCTATTGCLTTYGAFYAVSGYNYDATSQDGMTGGNRMYMDASRYNPIYGNSSNVTPVNTAVYAYMYAGKSDATKGSAATIPSSCVKGNYFYTDGTCSSSYNSAKTVKGIVYSISQLSSYTYITYVWGGTSTSSTGTAASNVCRSANGWLASTSYFTSLPTSISTSQYVVRSVQVGQSYWSYTSGKYKCTSQTSCSAASDSSYAYYYCYSNAYFTK